MNSTGQKLFYFGVIILLIQNILFLVFEIGFPNYLEYVLYLDLVGFFLMGMGYIVFPLQNGTNKRFILAGILILGWLLARLIWQFVLLGGLSHLLSSQSTDLNQLINSLSSTNEKIMWLMLIGSLLLVFAAYFALKGASTGGKMFFTYTIINFISVLLFVQTFMGFNFGDSGTETLIGLIMKLFLVPLLGVITFAVMMFKSKKHFGINS